ncbi:hypothetical protein MAR_022628 [Mya arenaria]|uniref:Uncharacterized protein n=1 Tax=Mya arenaria TaxID=6604 RepID=A0ABY7DTH7_MYAAR|nr:hypothetical protein MAR_022628 [Mya arenaria]
MDAGIIQTLKLKYRKRQLADVLDGMDINSSQTGSEILRVLNILQAMKCGFEDNFSNASDHEESSQDRDDIDEYDIPQGVLWLSRDLFRQDFNTLAGIDSNVYTCDNSMTDWGRPASEIISEMRNSAETSSNLDDDDKDEECVRSEKVVSTSEVSDCSDTIKAFALQQLQSDMLGMMSAQDLWRFYLNAQTCSVFQSPSKLPHCCKSSMSRYVWDEFWKIID